MSNMMTYTGLLKVKSNEVKISDKFKKRDFVVTDDSQSYPQTILFELTQDRCSLLDPIKVGDEITVHFSLRGREWKNPQGEIRYFNTLQAFRIQKINNSKQAESKEEETYTSNTVMPTPDDDLPF